MFCKKCGTLLADTSKFCPKCGTSVSSVNPMKTVANQTSPDKTLLFRMNKKHIITISIILSLLITCVSLLAIFVFPHADIYAFQYQIKTGDYQQAYLTYDNLEYEELSKVNVWMKEYASSVEEEYYNGQTDYNTAIQIISSICRYDIKTVYEIKNNILLDNESNILFNQGKAYAEDSQWKEAYLTLQEIDTDYRLYNEVTPLLTDYASNFRSDVLSKMTNLSNNDEIDEMKSIRDNALIVIPDDAEIQNGYKDQLNAFIDRKISEASAHGTYCANVQVYKTMSAGHSFTMFGRKISNENSVRLCKSSNMTLPQNYMFVNIYFCKTGIDFSLILIYKYIKINHIIRGWL